MTVSRARVRRVPVRPVQERYLKPVERKSPAVAQSKPQLLRQLQLLQTISVGTTLVLTSCVFGLYAWSVKSQKQWDRQYEKLEYLKQMEGKLINAAEALDHDRIQSAWAGEHSLTRETPARTLFLESMPPRSPLPYKEVEKTKPPQIPIAY